MFKLDLEKAQEQEIKLPTPTGPSKKQKNSRKTSTTALLITPKPFDCVGHNKLENSLRDGNTRPPYLPPRNLYAGQEATVRTGHGTTDWFQTGQGVHQHCLLSSCLFNMLSTS